MAERACSKSRAIMTIQVQMHPGETVADFMVRIRRERLWHQGDTVTFVNRLGRMNTVRISRVVR